MSKTLKTLTIDVLHHIGPTPLGVRARVWGTDASVALSVTFFIRSTGGHIVCEHLISWARVQQIAEKGAVPFVEVKRIFEQAGNAVVEDVWASAKEWAKPWVGDDALWQQTETDSIEPFFMPGDEEEGG